MTRPKWKAYDYKIQAGPGMSWVHRPMINIEVWTLDGRDMVPILAMIDSGTDGTVFHANIAESLGIDESMGRKGILGGIGSLDGFYTEVKIVVPDFNISYKAPVFFGKNLPMDGLLGQATFFPQFKIRFEKAENKFYLAVS
ncbi:hypothetical protein HZC00_03525 [Candidatus Kaiserbacteria bacterium]|nr:hypothetical protein [Candidatus Kaiserbacteria bacterium]